jgi:HEAT repeat protein
VTRPSTPPDWEFLLKKAWDPRWEHVIVLVTGKLSLDPARYLLERLAYEAEDDAFCHRLALASQCLPEIQPQSRPHLLDLRDRIATDIFGVWWTYALHHPACAFSHLRQGLSAAVRAGSCIDLGALPGYLPTSQHPSWTRYGLRRNLLLVLGDMLRDGDHYTQEAAAELVTSVGQSASIDPVLTGLAGLLLSPIYSVLDPAAKAVASVGTAPTIEPILAHLGDLVLQYPDPETRRANAEIRQRTWWKPYRDVKLDLGEAALDAVRRLGPAAGTVSFLSRLVDLLQHPNPNVQEAAAKAVSSIGPAAATGPMLSRLADLLLHPDTHVQTAAIQAVASLGAAAATEAILSQLTDLLHPGSPVLTEAAKAIANIGVRAATEPIVGRLTDLLVAHLADLLPSSDADMSQNAAMWSVAHAIESFGAAARDPILARLTDLLQHSDPLALQAAATAVQTIGKAAATEPILDRLADLLQHPDPDVLNAAASAIAELGARAAIDPILDRLADLLQHSDPNVLRTAVRAVTRLGAAGREPFLSQLTDLLQHSNPIVQEAGAEAVASIGEAAATGPILSRLADLLYADYPVLTRAADAVAALGAAAATEPILAHLVGLLLSPNLMLSAAALRAFDGLGAAAATESVLSRLTASLQRPYPLVLERAVAAVGRIGRVAATEPLLACFMELLNHSSREVRGQTAHTLARLMDQGSRLFYKETAGRWTVSKVEELSN